MSAAATEAELAFDDVPVDREISPVQVVGLMTVSIGAVILLSRLMDAFALRGPALPLNIGFKLVTASVVLTIIDRLGWWHRTGFRGPSRWSRLWLGWLPLLYLVLVLLPGFPSSGVLRTVGIAVLTFAVGLDEEAWTRGLLLESLRHRGTTQAVLLSGAFFGVIHSLNLLSGQPTSTTAVQVFVAVAFGVGLGTLRVRTHSIWPCIFVHAAWDFALILRSGEIGESSGTGFGQALVTVGIMAPLLLYGLFLIRPSKVPGADGRMRRPLVAAPAAADPGVAPGVAPGRDALGAWPVPPPEVAAVYRGE